MTNLEAVRARRTSHLLSSSAPREEAYHLIDEDLEAALRVVEADVGASHLFGRCAVCGEREWVSERRTYEVRHTQVCPLAYWESEEVRG